MWHAVSNSFDKKHVFISVSPFNRVTTLFKFVKNKQPQVGLKVLKVREIIYSPPLTNNLLLAFISFNLFLKHYVSNTRAKKKQFKKNCTHIWPERTCRSIYFLPALLFVTTWHPKFTALVSFSCSLIVKQEHRTRAWHCSLTVTTPICP